MTNVSCGACGTAAPPGAAFCGSCGTPLSPSETAAPPAPVLQQQPPTDPAQAGASAIVGQNVPASAAPGQFAAQPVVRNPDSPVPEVRQVEVNLPAWLGQDWATPAVLGIGSPLIGAGLLMLGLIPFLVWTSTLPAGFRGGYLGLPFTQWAAYNSIPVNEIMVFTGLLWILLSFGLAGKLAGKLRPQGSDPSPTQEIGSIQGRTFGAAAKTALLYAMTSLMVGLVGKLIVDPDSIVFISTQREILDPNLAATFFFGLLIGFGAALRWLLKNRGVTLSQAMGVTVQLRLPDMLRHSAAAGWSGAKTFLLIGVTAMGLLWTIILIIAVSGGLGAQFGAVNVFGSIVIGFTNLVIRGVDTGVGALIESMRFFLGEGFTRLTINDVPGWAYVSILVPVAAAATAGWRAAQTRAAGDVREALSAGAAVGPLVMIPCALWAVLNAEAVGAGFVAAAFFLPLLWGCILGIVGAWYQCARSGMSTGLGIRVVSNPAVGAAPVIPPTAQPTPVPQAPSPQPAPQPAPQPEAEKDAPAAAKATTKCPSCDSEVAPDALFCEACGTRVSDTGS